MSSRKREDPASHFPGKELKEVKIKVGIQGSPVVDHCYILEKGLRVAALLLTMKSKCCQVLACGSYEDECGIIIPELTIEATESSSRLHRNLKNYPLTCVVFPEFVGWRTWSARSMKYGVAICLVKAGRMAMEADEYARRR